MDTQYCPLEHEALLHISGPDSLKFLQGQTTCDTSYVDSHRAVLGAYCNPQGRMNSDFILCELGHEHYALRMRASILQSTAAIFSKYIIFSKAELESENSNWQCLAFWGADIREALGNIVPDLPQGRLGAVQGEGFTLIQIDESGTQYECYIDIHTGADLMQTFTEVVSTASESDWQALQIESGIGRIEDSTVEEFIPQMLNYDITGHVNFTKGCYTGQEVVARMHYRGKPKRRLYLATLPGAEIPMPGTPLFSAKGEQSVGNIVNSAIGNNEQLVSLVVATEGGVENGLQIGAVDGPALELAVLPYSMDQIKPA